MDPTPTTAVSVSPDLRTLAILGRENLPSIANLSKPILRLAGYRIDPATNGPAEVRVAWLNALSFKDVASGRTIAVPLPAGTRFSTPDWSPDGNRMAFVAQEPNGLALWIADRSGTARRLIGGLNAAFGRAYEGMPGGRSLGVRLGPAGRGAAPAAEPDANRPCLHECHRRRCCGSGRRRQRRR